MTLDQFTSIDSHRYIAFPLNNDGSLDLTEDVCGGGVQDLYEGTEFIAPTAFDLNLGGPRQIPVVAQGQVWTTFMLPSIDAKTGVLRTAYDKFSLHALLADTLVDTVGEAKLLGIDTDKAGQEKLVGLLLTQLQAHDEAGNTVNVSTILNRVRIVANWPGYVDTAMIKEYQLSLSRSTKRLWGETYAEGTHGHTSSVGDRVLSQYKFNLGFWMGNGEYTTFHLPADKLARTNSAVKVWDFSTGAARAGSWDAATNASVFTPSVLVPDGIVMACAYEYE
jgi:hypothetical protein